MKIEFHFDRSFYKHGEFYIGLFSVMLGTAMFFAKNNDTGLYLDYPRTIFWGLILIGVLMMGKAMFLARPGGEARGIEPIDLCEVAILALILFAQPLITSLGMYPALFLLCVAISLLINDRWTLRRIAGIIAYDLVLIVACWLCFSVVFGAHVPAGIWL